MEKMQELIDKSRHVDKDMKKLLSALFKGLEESQEHLYQDVREVCQREGLWYYSQQENWQIRTGLIDREYFEEELEYNDSNLTLMMDINAAKEQLQLREIEEKEENCDDELGFMGDGFTYIGIAFLDCPYERIMEYTQDNGKHYTALVQEDDESYTVEYHLERWYGLIDVKERMVEITADQLGNAVANPYIFSPWSRHAVAVKLDFNGREPGDNCEINLQLETNGLNGILLLDKLPVWNVTIDDNPTANETHGKLAEKVRPHFSGKNFRIYDFKHFEANDFLYMDPFYLESVEVRRISKDSVGLGCPENTYLSDLHCKKISLNEISWPGEMAVFENRRNIEGPCIAKIRTMADLKLAITAYMPEGLELEKVSFLKPKGTEVERYTQETRYEYGNDLALTKARPCYIKFKSTVEDNLFTDRVNYMLCYLEGQYPEFDWYGVC